MLVIPVPRPATVPAASPAALAPTGMTAAALCRDPRLEGEAIDPIRNATLPCGIPNPVRLEAVAGVRLSPSARLGCPTARALADWIAGTLRPASREILGSPPRSIRVAGSYVCRTRNHKPGGRISEHGKGRAIDISAISFADGQRITITDDWGRGDPGRLLSRVRREACGRFMTVLGPGSDAHHENHFHFDTAVRGGAPWCR